MRTSSVLTASLLITISLFGHAMAETTVDEPFGILFFEIGQPGSRELSFTDSLMSLIEANLSELEGIEVIRPAVPLLSEEEFETLIDSGELDADAAACMMLQTKDTTKAIYCSYMIISDPADEEDQPYNDQNGISLEEWPIDPESEQAAVLVPFFTTFIEVSRYFRQGLQNKALETMISMIDYLEGTDLHALKTVYHLLLAQNMLLLSYDTEVVLAEIDRALELDSLSSDAYRIRGLLLYYSGDIQAAIENATNAISLDSLNRMTVKLRGNISLILGDNQGAINDYTRAVELDPTDADALNMRGMAYELLGQIEMSLEDYKAAIEVDPCFIEAYMNAGRVYNYFDDLETAEDLFVRGLEANPGNPTMMLTVGLLRSNWETVLVASMEGILISPDDSLFYRWRGTALLELGDYAAALADYTFVRECFNSGNYGTVIGAEGLAMIAELERFLEHPEGSLEFYVQRGMYHSGRSMYQKAVDDFTEALSLPDTDPDIYYHRVLCRERTSDISGAREDLQSFLDSDPSSSLKKRMAEQMLERLN
jgi:tetratricopeptide (TPR) repeat protein